MHQAILNSRPDAIVPTRDTKYRLICNAAGGLLPVLAEELKNAFGATILPSYGSTVRPIVACFSARAHVSNIPEGMHANRESANVIST